MQQRRATRAPYPGSCRAVERCTGSAGRQRRATRCGSATPRAAPWCRLEASVPASRGALASVATRGLGSWRARHQSPVRSTRRLAITALAACQLVSSRWAPPAVGICETSPDQRYDRLFHYLPHRPGKLFVSTAHCFKLEHQTDRHSCLSKPAPGSAITMRPPSSARAAWGRSIRPAMPNSTAQSRSTSCFGGYVGDRDRVVALEWP